ncbi:MAG: hypothetical protein K6U89_04310 [Chloroflexi bacterium]|nr:hypothetical protein [Chloroflexota bacterium]GIW10200.1 MAG: hypothetical protein KatS3mg061_1257 [Dehalococcoidia bacterium]
MSEANTRVKPEIAIDLDGVICRPPLGVNVAIGRSLKLRPLPEDIQERNSDQRRAWWILRYGLEALKYFGRRPLPDAKEGLAAISELRTPVVVTARNAIGVPLIERWLELHGLRENIATVIGNNTRLSPAQHKLRIARLRGIREHVDDDGSVAYYLARNHLERVYLREWLFNRGLPYPENVIRVERLIRVAEDLRRRAAPLAEKA